MKQEIKSKRRFKKKEKIGQIKEQAARAKVFLFYCCLPLVIFNTTMRDLSSVLTILQTSRLQIRLRQRNRAKKYRSDHDDLDSFCLS